MINNHRDRGIQKKMLFTNSCNNLCCIDVFNNLFETRYELEKKALNSTARLDFLNDKIRVYT